MKSRSHISLMFTLVGIMIAFISICPVKATENAEVINRPYYQTSTNSGTWVQASDGRWWYKYSDGSYPKSQFLKISGYYYYFDSNGWMLTGWQKINSLWYYFTEANGSPPKGSMVTGMRRINGNTFYFSSSGVMQTGWQHYCPGHISHRGYEYDFTNLMWVFHDENGYIEEITDVKGCSFGELHYSHHTLSSLGKSNSFPVDIFYWSDIEDSEINENIDTGIMRWKKSSLISISKGLSSSKSNIVFTTGKFSSEYIIASTSFKKNGYYLNPEATTQNWDLSIIKIAPTNSVISNPDETYTERGTYAHEVGHALGLTHRILNKDSVLVQVAYDRATQYPGSIDFNGVAHLKNMLGE